MLEDAVLRALEDSGHIGAVARQGSGIAGDYKLVMDVRRFEADYAGAAVPAATIEINAKLLHPADQPGAASRTLLASRSAAEAGVPARPEQRRVGHGVGVTRGARGSTKVSNK